MQKKHISFLLIALVIATGVACNSSKNKQVEAEDSMAIDAGWFYFDTLKGIYAGDFGESELRLVINYVSEGHAVGYNIVKGLQRNLGGKVIMTAETIEMELAEPGDNKYDGVFHISINRTDFTRMSGTWKPNDPTLKSRTFTLKKQEESEESETITSSNFTYTFGYVSDSLGEITFDPDGLCTYSYYPKKDNQEYRDQKEEFTGSWTIKDDKLVIQWQENPVFPSKLSVFNISRDEENYGHSLQGEGRELFGYNY